MHSGVWLDVTGVFAVLSCQTPQGCMASRSKMELQFSTAFELHEEIEMASGPAVMCTRLSCLAAFGLPKVVTSHFTSTSAKRAATPSSHCAGSDQTHQRIWRASRQLAASGRAPSFRFFSLGRSYCSHTSVDGPRQPQPKSTRSSLHLSGYAQMI